ncbi:MAG: Fe-S cluster assembly sulfur transfer protein SufU [Verrucomicrobiota bacterium]
MSDDLKALYQEIILRHNKAPNGKSEAPDEWAKATGRNPVCGDEVRLALNLDPDAESIDEARFQGASCAICTASTSMMVDAVSGKTTEDARQLCSEVFDALSGGALLSEERHGDIFALNGVHQFPARLRCARLPWEVLHQILSSEG